ncbi:MAG: outer membrane protein [Parvicella sp.]|jgi:outer membrane protein
MDIKKLTILNLVLAIAVVILFAMHFMGGTSETTTTTDTAAATTDEKIEINDSDTSEPAPLINNLADGNLKVAWIDRTKVSEKFKLSLMITKQLQDEQITAEARVKEMETNFQKKYSTFEKEAKIMGDMELQQKQQELGQLQQKYQIDAQKLEQELAISSQEKQLGYAEISEEYMLEIAQELGYDYIISYSLGGNVWCANPALDITEITIQKLNEKFAKSDLSKSADGTAADTE